MSWFIYLCFSMATPWCTVVIINLSKLLKLPVLQVDSTSETSVCENKKIISTHLTWNKLHIHYVQHNCRSSNKIDTLILLSVHKALLWDFNRHKIKIGRTEQTEMCILATGSFCSTNHDYRNHTLSGNLNFCPSTTHACNVELHITDNTWCRYCKYRYCIFYPDNYFRLFISSNCKMHALYLPHISHICLQYQ